jgi:competence protein ComEC
MLAGLVVWSAAGLATLPGPDRERTAARCTFLSLGHGGCTFCEFPDGSNLMYDAGSLGSPDFAARTVAQFLAARGVRRIDRLIISHADLDHFNAVPGILACFPVGTIYVPPHMTDPARQQADEPGLPYLLAEIRRRAVPLENLAAGADVELAGGQGRLRVLHPPPGPTEGSDNAASLVTAVEFAGRRLLLTGDLQSPGLETVTRQPAWDCDVLLAPHHGSAHSDPPGFAAWSTPEWVVISGGGRASTLSTVAAYQACGACVLETAEQGAVELLLDPKGVRAATYRQGAFDPRPRPAAASRPSGPAKSTFGTAGLENGSP